MTTPAPDFEELKPRIEKRPCHICAGTDFEWGYMNASYSKAKYSWQQRLMSVRRCTRCQNVQMFSDEQFTKQTYQMSWLFFFLAILLMIALCAFSIIPDMLR